MLSHTICQTCRIGCSTVVAEDSNCHFQNAAHSTKHDRRYVDSDVKWRHSLVIACCRGVASKHARVLRGAMQCMEPTSTHMQPAATPQPRQAHTKANTQRHTSLSARRFALT
jgi:ribonuclease PH